MTVNVTENTSLSHTVTASDPDGDSLTFSITGGTDAARFSIAPNGQLTLNVVPNYEKPQDSNQNNDYRVQITVSDGQTAPVARELSVVVVNSREGISVRRVATGLTQPLWITAIPGSSHVLVAGKTGAVYDINPAASGGSVTTVLNAGGLGTGGEGGLLAVLPAANYGTSGRLYAYAVGNDSDHTIQIREYTGVGQGSLPTSFLTLLTVPHPDETNHFGGWLGWGPDGYLYAATGDGGGGNDVHLNSQNTNKRLGKILRMEVSTAPSAVAPAPGNPYLSGGGDPYVFALGLRNPYRNSFYGNRILIGDVGQSAREEVDSLLITSTPALNFGWPDREGSIKGPGTGPGGYVSPVTDYTRGSGPYQGATVIGGYVYTGPIASLQNFYVFGDYISGNLWAVPIAQLLGGGIVAATEYERKNEDFTPTSGTIDDIVCFGTDSAGNLYIVDIDGDVFIIEPA